MRREDIRNLSVRESINAADNLNRVERMAGRSVPTVWYAYMHDPMSVGEVINTADNIRRVDRMRARSYNVDTLITMTIFFPITLFYLFYITVFKKVSKKRPVLADMMLLAVMIAIITAVILVITSFAIS